MLKLISNLKIIKIIVLPIAFCALSVLNSCTYQQPDDFQYVKPYQQQAVPIQRPRFDGYYYNQPQSGYGNYQNLPPASRYYNNPYAMPPQNAYPYYDQDQYYKPPSAYGATDNVPESSNRY